MGQNYPKCVKVAGTYVNYLKREQHRASGPVGSSLGHIGHRDQRKAFVPEINRSSSWDATPGI